MKKRAKPLKTREPVHLVFGARTKATLNAYSEISLALSPLDQEQRVRVVKAVAIILGIAIK